MVMVVQKNEEPSAEDWAAIDEGIADSKAGRVVDRAAVHEGFRVRREARSTKPVHIGEVGGPINNKDPEVED